MNTVIPAESIKVGDVIMPPARELQLWMRRHVQEHNLPECALHLTVTKVCEGTPDARGRWLVVCTEQDAAWGAHRFPFTFKMRPGTPWPRITEAQS